MQKSLRVKPLETGLFGIDKYVSKRYSYTTADDISSADRLTKILDAGEKMRQENQALTEGVYYILISLFEPLHGYGIMQNVETISKGRVRLSPGTLYGALRTLVERGWIHVDYHDRDSGKREYVITGRGKDAVSAEIHRLRELLANGENATGGME